jgi:hypothetical protein
MKISTENLMMSEELQGTPLHQVISSDVKISIKIFSKQRK